jgi:hypothetical protein
MRRPADAYWYRLKDRARVRGRGKCEFCQLRQVYALHHRSYAREGREGMADVMAVCWTCHRVIHRRYRRSTYKVKPGSLAAQGDKGLDYFAPSKLWARYLVTRKL